MKELIEQTKDYIATELNRKSYEIIKELLTEYENKINKYKNELISDVVNNIEIRYAQTNDRDLVRLQIEIINKYKKGD